MNEHGSIDLVWNDSLLTLTANGPFNLDGAISCFKQLEHCIASANQPNWQRLDLVGETAFGEPEVMKIFSKSYLWAFEHGCTAFAIVCKEPMQRTMCKRFINANSINMQVFDSQQKAHVWLSEQ